MTTGWRDGSRAVVFCSVVGFAVGLIGLSEGCEEG